MIPYDTVKIQALKDKMDNAKQHYIKVNIFTDEAPYIINLSVVRHAETDHTK
jgi:hypothetical protein